jgi:hypothetical protein
VPTNASFSGKVCRTPSECKRRQQAAKAPEAATPVPAAKAAKAPKTAEAPCPKCGRVNAHGRACRNVAACKARVQAAA